MTGENPPRSGRRRTSWIIWFTGDSFDSVVIASHYSGTRVSDFIHDAVLEKTQNVIDEATSSLTYRERLTLRIATIRSLVPDHDEELDFARLQFAYAHSPLIALQPIILEYKEKVRIAISADHLNWPLQDLAHLLDNTDLSEIS